MDWVKWGILFVLIAAGTLVRVLGAVGTDLQIDEIFTLRQLSNLDSATGLLAASLNNDNNHLLTSWYCLAVGRVDAWLYRLPSVLAGVLCIPMTYIAARQAFDSAAARWACALSAVSYPMIYYSTEARGYAVASLCGLIAFALLLRMRLRGARMATRGGFWLSCVLGFLGHYTFVMVLIGFWIGEALSLMRRRPSAALPARREAASAHLPVLGVVIALYLVRVRHMDVFGGPIYTWLTVATWTLAESFNLAPRPPAALAWTATAVVLALSGWALWRMQRAQHNVPALLLMTLLAVAPVLVLALSRPVCLYPRYFFVLVPFLILLLGYGMAAGAAAGPPIRAATYLCAIVYFGLGMQRAWGLLENGKSHYADVLPFMARTVAAKDTMRVSGLKPWPVELTLEYYRQQRAPARKDLVLVSPQELLEQQTSVDFLVLTRDTIEHYGQEPETLASFQFGAHVYQRCLYQPSADRIEADWIVYCSDPALARAAVPD